MAEEAVDEEEELLPTSISEAKMNDQRSDSYQPRERGDHSKVWILGGVGEERSGATRKWLFVWGREVINAW